MFCELDLNRRNINRAISDNMLDDLGMNTNNFNCGQTVRPKTHDPKDLGYLTPT